MKENLVIAVAYLLLCLGACRHIRSDPTYCMPFALVLLKWLVLEGGVCSQQSALVVVSKDCRADL